MRIISGKWRGRRLLAPKGDTTRPTAERTRETLFSMLTSRLGSFDELSVLDLFAGSGALGLEALSRGAKSATFVEQDRSALQTLKSNIDALQATEQAEIQPSSVMALGAARNAYDLILMDPPYQTGAGAVALDRLNRLGWVAPYSWIAIETSASEDVKVNGFQVESERKVGKALLHIIRPA